MIAAGVLLALILAGPTAAGQDLEPYQATVAGTEDASELSTGGPAEVSNRCCLPTTDTTHPSASHRPESVSAGYAAQQVTVMSRNLYLGADLNPVFAAVGSGDPQNIIGAVSDAWESVLATNFPERAEALADEISASQPLLVGLQEVSLYRTGPPDSLSANPTPATHVELDYLQILLAELQERNLHYTPVAVTQNADVENPGFTAPGVLQDIRLTDRDVILARTDLPASRLKLSNVQTGNFSTNLSLPIGQSGQSITIVRGWTSVDVKVRGKKFRFINTHLEQESTNPALNTIQVAQANELLSGPANTELPVILVGDFNSRADGTGTPTYSMLVEAGFKDAWSATHPGEAGNTFGHTPDLRNTTVSLTERIDLVLFRGGIRALDAYVVGEELTDRNPSGLWPSDHAGVVAKLALRHPTHYPATEKRKLGERTP